MDLTSWFLALVVIPSVAFVPTTGDFPSGANQAVRCMLAYNSPPVCAFIPKVIVPGYLLQEYNDGPLSLHTALHNKTLNQLTQQQLADIPLSLLYLIPRGRLADLNVDQLRAILQRHTDDTSLYHQVVACLHHGNRMSKLIEKMNNTSVSEESLRILAESVKITDLSSDFLKFSFIEKEPLLAYLRPEMLFSIDTSNLYTLFNILQLTKRPSNSAFYFLAETEIRHKIPLSKLSGFVLGLSPDKLMNESISFENTVSDFRLDLSILQARALFQRIYQNISLTRNNFIDSKPLLFKLSPALLQRFPENIYKYEVNYIEQIKSIPLPTASQITEYVKADCMLTGRLPKEEDTFWDIQIRHLGKWVFTLPLSALENYKTFHLTTAVLNSIESPALSPMQAYYLTSRGEVLEVTVPNSVLELETFLHALPASQLVNRKVGEISSQVLSYLVSKLPANNLPRTLSLVNKISSSIGYFVDIAADDNDESSILEDLLGNSDVNQMMELLSPKDLTLSLEAILKLLSEKRIRDMFSQIIEQLPQQILAALLDFDRLSNASHWRWSHVLRSSHVSSLLIGGLTCPHIKNMDTGLFIPIMSRYNSIRKKPFPKNLQHCCLRKLIDHLKLKMTLTQTDPDLGLISLLEPIEIESIGGYVLVNIPVEALRVSPYLGHILSTIGKLSGTELMLSTTASQLQQIAELSVDKEGSVNPFMVRNLVWYLALNTSTPDLRLMMEAQLLDTTICLPAEHRRYVASRLISIFGTPEVWSEGVLATLQDLLIVFTDEELNKVSQSSWTKAADSLTSHYSDLVDWIEPSAFYKVCAQMLGVSEGNKYMNDIGRYTRFRLNAAQWLLDTVLPISNPEVLFPTYFSMEIPSTEKTTTEKTTTEKIAREENTTENNITEEISAEEFTTEKIITEESSAEKSFQQTFSGNGISNGETTESSTSGKVSTVNESLNTSKDNVTQNTDEENSSAETFFEEISVKDKLEENKNSILNNITTKPTSLDSSSMSIDDALEITNSTSEKNESLYANKSEIENLSSCDNLVDDCQNNTSSTTSEPISVNEITNVNDTASMVNTEASPVYSDIESVSTEKKSGYSFQNKTQDVVVNTNSTLKGEHLETENKFDESSVTSSSLSTPNEKLPPTEQSRNSSDLFDISEQIKPDIKTNISFESSATNETVSFTTESIGSTEDEVSEGSEEVLLNNDDGIIIKQDKVAKKKKRSIFQSTNNIKSVQFSCNAIKMIGSVAELTLTASDLNKMLSDEIANCRVEFGKMELGQNVQKIIWRRIVHVKQDGIHLLGKLLRFVTVGDLWDIGLQASNPWILETIHGVTRHSNSTTVLKKLLTEVDKYNTELSIDLLAVLGPEVCSIEESRLRELSVIGLDLGPSCAPCLPYLAQRATQELEGVDTWTPHFVHSLQSIVAGLDLDSWKQLALSDKIPLSGLQPSASRCLNTSHLEVLSPDQIRLIPATSLFSLSQHQLAAFNSTQLEAVNKVIYPTITEKMTPSIRVHVAGFPSEASGQVVPTVLLISLISITNFLIFR